MARVGEGGLKGRGRPARRNKAEKEGTKRETLKKKTKRRKNAEGKSTAKPEKAPEKDLKNFGSQRRTSRERRKQKPK